MTELDQFRGRFQAALFGSLAEHVERLTWDHARVEAFQRERLRTLLAVAIERSPFHARRLTAIDPATFELADLTRLPVMTKAELMCQFDDVSTDRRLTLAAADEAISATGTEPRPVGGELIVLASGGSTGTRGVFAFDADSFAEYAATLLRPAVARRSGAAPAASGPTVIVAAGSAIHATGAGPALLEGSPVARSPACPSPSRSTTSSRQAQRTATRRPVRLSEHPRRAPVVNSYGASEGLVGSTSPDDSTLTFASDCCIVELVDEHNTPVPPGTTSDADPRHQSVQHGPTAHSLPPRGPLHPPPGRRQWTPARPTSRAVPPPCSTTATVAVHPLAIKKPLTAHPDVLDYQARQTTTGVAVDIVTAADVDTTQLAADLGAALSVAGLTDPNIDVRVVSRLERDTQSGKQRAQFVAAPRNRF